MKIHILKALVNWYISNQNCLYVAGFTVKGEICIEQSLTLNACLYILTKFEGQLETLYLAHSPMFKLSKSKTAFI